VVYSKENKFCDKKGVTGMGQKNVSARKTTFCILKSKELLKQKIMVFQRKGKCCNQYQLWLISRVFCSTLLQCYAVVKKQTKVGDQHQRCIRVTGFQVSSTRKSGRECITWAKLLVC